MKIIRTGNWLTRPNDRLVVFMLNTTIHSALFFFILHSEPPQYEPILTQRLYESLNLDCHHVGLYVDCTEPTREADKVIHSHLIR